MFLNFLQQLSLVTILTGCLLFAGCHTREANQSEKKNPIKVTLAKVEERAISQPIYTSGTLSTKELIKLSFKTGGIIRHIYVSEGATVTRGQKLAQLDLAEISARLQQAKTAYENAQTNFARMQNLYEDSVITKEQLQNASSQLEVAKSDMEIAQFNYDQSLIKAPASGKITEKLAEENELIPPGVPVLLLASTEENYVIRVGLTEKDILKVQIGDSATVQFNAYPGMQFPATVQSIAAALDIRTGTYEVELSLSATDKKLLTGFTAGVTIFPSLNEKMKLIPIESLIRADGFEGVVYTVSDSAKAVQVPVKVAFIVDDKVAVKSGLENIDQVVEVGADYLHHGAKVEVQN